MHKEEDKTDKASAGIIRAGAEETPTCEAVTDSTPVSKKCAQNKCDVTIGGNEYCSQCSTAAEYLIDGACKTANDISNADTICVSPAEGKCGSCGSGYFMYKGGCYKFAGGLGSLICADPESGAAAGKAGVCTKCVEGFFKHPSPANNKQSCIACNETDTIDDVKGVLKCKICNPPNDIGAATCTVCEDGTFVNNSGVECKACTDPCATCTGAENTKCTSCKEGATPYFKEGTNGDGTGTCVAEGGCGNTHFPVAADKKCYPCSNTDKGGIASCQTCTPKAAASLAETPSVTCSACTTPTKKPNADGTKCVDCAAAGCAKCSDEGVCVQCSTDNYLTPTGQCVDSCAKLGGYYADGQRVCQPCDPSCASCSTAGPDKCLSCPAGKVLKYTNDSDPSQGGSCVDECTPGTGAGGCETCGATIGGSKYCSKCSDVGQAPLNGDCAANTARTQFCTQVDGGACTQCKSGYFLLDGGCYQTTRQPGSQVCTAADATGKCKTCTNGQTADTSTGVCPACPAGCSKCSGSSTCTACLAGYYLSGTKCVKCDKDDSNIKGVPNCVSCAAPSSNSGTVTCYVTQEPTVDPTDPSVNKTGLSSGAIAGISVAVIAVVGGLVGFLCWWFICRGKA